ncbi:unnamed protein product [Adineta ricciae]|uniref:Uncharacterized protein n=1 Tax=Adineta ricciae TaxID=249248 RepID=A0A816GHE9_ADIRI|nr:unnamed protein product [Adineta ricciae]
MVNYDRFYKNFMEFWSLHSTFHPCKLSAQDSNNEDLCSAAIICDGHMKIRRRLCANTNVPLSVPAHFIDIFKPLIVGCSHTPCMNEALCSQCKNNNVILQKSTSRAANKRREVINQRSKPLESNHKNEMAELTCNVHKEDIMIDDSIRACGILVLATNCQVIVGFEEILRSESRKQIIQAISNLYTIAPMLTRIFIYDSGCLLAKSVRATLANESVSNKCNTYPGIKALTEIRFFVDRFHLSNHRDKYCHTHLNLDSDDTLKDINSSSCEQINSWIKSYSHMLSNMNEYRFAAVLLVLFHLRNCSHTKLSNRLVDVKKTLLQNTNAFDASTLPAPNPKVLQLPKKLRNT